MMTNHNHEHDPIPGAPADSLVGLGGDGGVVGQIERDLCASTPPPPPPVDETTHESLTRSYPPIPIPNVGLPDMPLRARMLRPWMGVAGAAVLIALVSLASGDDEEASTAQATGTEAAEVEDDGVARSTSFGPSVAALAAAAVDQARAEAERASKDEASEGDDEARDEAAASSASEGESDRGDDDRAASSARDDLAPAKKKSVDHRARGPFDRDAARSAIFGAASRASGCRTKNGPRGRGRATVTIGPSGAVSSVSVSPPFAGTKSGRCVASVFRSVRIAPFSGSAVSLGKSFSIR